MTDVVLKYCKYYDVDRIQGLLQESMEILGINLGQEVAGKKVLIKPNLLSAHRPEKAVTTHPAVIEAIIRILSDFDCELWLGDSPNGVQKSLDDVWEKTGMRSLCDRYGVEKKFFERHGATLTSDHLISNVPLEADYIINVPKFKTHGLTVLTVAVKNMFGIVPGLKKTDYHRNFPLREDFGRALVKIAEVKRPNLNIVDGIEAMAGNGPSGGYKINTGLLAVGEDMHQVDLLLAKLVGLDPHHVDTLGAAFEMGRVDLNKGPALGGDDPADFDMSGFKLPVSYTKNLRNLWLFKFFVSRLMLAMRVRPQVRKERCIKCGMCVEICPVSVIEFKRDGYPQVDAEGCIECYCCHEACPEKAMALKESWCLKLVKMISSRISSRSESR